MHKIYPPAISFSDRMKAIPPHTVKTTQTSKPTLETNGLLNHIFPFTAFVCEVHVTLRPRECSACDDVL